MGKRIVFLRRWFAILYGFGFTGVLVFLVVVAHNLTNEIWLALLRPSISVVVNLPVQTIFWHSLAIVIAVATLGKLIERVDPRFRPRTLIASNLNFRLLLHPWLRYPFAALLLYNLPILAMLEEFIFRHGGMGLHAIRTWQDVLVSSILFGLFHALMSWNLRGGILQMVLGFWFSYQYLSSGACDPLIFASFSHFMVDLLVFTPGVVQLCFRPSLVVGSDASPACS